MKSWFKFLATTVLISIIVSGCSFGSSDKGKENEQTTIRVMYYDESSFHQEYGMLYSALYPNVEIEVISTQKMYSQEITDYNEATLKFIEEEKPDIVMLSSDQYKQLAEEGKLYDMDSLIEKDKYDIEGLVPGLVDYLRELGGGKIYALTPNFHSQVLFYNKDLFDQYQIEYPTDKMSWYDVIQLAQRFPTDGEPKDRIYGLKLGYSEDVFEIASTIAASESLSYVNATQKQMTIDSEAWKNIFETTLNVMKSDTLFYESRMYEQQSMESTTYEHYLLRDPFISGKLAMMIGQSYQLNEFKQAVDVIGPDSQTKVLENWDMVTVPVGTQNPDQNAMMSFYNLLGINAESPNKEAAWDFIKYITGDEFARVKSKSHYNGLPVRTKYIDQQDGRNYAAFYSLKPSTFNAYKDFEKLPENFWMEFMGAAQQELAKVKDGTAELDATLALLQVKGQEMLDKAPPADEQPAEGAESTLPAEGVTEEQTDAAQ